MPIDLPTLRRAQKLRRDAVEEFVNESFPTVTRMAYGLTGRDDAGAGVVSFVLKRGLRSFPKFRDESEPQRWFLHHTVLACRQDRRRPAGDDDLLMETTTDRSPRYVAFVRALRTLPQQQIEAFLLHHGESFNLRFLAITMDCSIKAAEQHLAAATTALRAIAGETLEPMTQQLRQAYQALSPSGQVQLPNVGRMVRLHVWPRRAWKMLKAAASIAIVAGVVWACWKILPAIEY